jgi:hypothetical protein
VALHFSASNPSTSAKSMGYFMRPGPNCRRWVKDRILPYTTVRKLPRASQIEDDKTIDARLDEIITRTRRRHPSPGSVDGSGYGGPDPTTAPPSTPTSTKPSTLGGDIST